MSTSNWIDFSQYGQPKLIRKYLPAAAPRWLVDVGAHDGIDGSNSRGFILEDWNALLIEPLPSVFEHLRANSSGFKNVILEQCACAELDGEATFHIGLDGPDGQSSSLCEDEVWKSNHSGREIQVRVQRLHSLLEKHNCPADFALLLVDAEGMDLEVLRSLDFSRYRPAVICTEIYQANPGKDKLKAQYLTSNGYQLRGQVGSDTIWSRMDIETAVNEVADGAADFSETELYSGDELPSEVAELPVKNGGTAAFDFARSAAGILTVSGWAFGPDQTVSDLLFVGMKTDYGFTWRQSDRCVRSDVARHFGNQGLLFSGFRASFPDPAGSQVEIRVVQVQGDSRWDILGSVPRTIS